MPIRPLHWEGHFKLRAGEIAIVDEADALSAAMLLKLLNAAGAAQARLLLLRRPVRAGWMPSVQLDALVQKTGRIRLRLPAKGIEEAMVRRDYPALLDALSDAKRIRHVVTADDLVGFAMNAAQSAARRNIAPFFLCSDMDIVAGVLIAGLIVEKRPGIGSRIPPDHRGPVVVLVGAGAAELPILPQLRGRNFLLVSTAEHSPNAQVLAARLALADGQASTLSCPFRPVPLSLINSKSAPETTSGDVLEPLSESFGPSMKPASAGPVQSRLFADHVAKIDALIDKARTSGRREGSGSPHENHDPQQDGAVGPLPRGQEDTS